MAIPRKWLNWSIDQRVNADLAKAGISIKPDVDAWIETFKKPAPKWIKPLRQFQKLANKLPSHADIIESLFSDRRRNAKYRVVKKMARKHGVPVIEIKPVKASPADFIGLPATLTDGKQIKWR